MDLQLGGKRALVTGSSSGIGAQVARLLAAEGAHVVVHGREADRTEAVAREIRGAGGRADAVVGDLATDAGADGVARGAERATGGVDILVNNAAVYINRDWATATAADWVDLYNVNVGSVVRLVRALVPGMRERGWGRVIQVASTEAVAPFPFMPDYAASKAALVNLTVGLSKYLAGTGVTANTITPGIIRTANVERWYRGEAVRRGWGETWDEVERGIVRDVYPNASGRIGREDEVAPLVAYLASPLAGFVNGSDYRLDGGAIGTVN